MTKRPHLLKDDNVLKSAGEIVDSGEFRFYESDPPDFLNEHDVHRDAGAHNCKMIVATAWGHGKIGNITPHGTTYLVFSYMDDAHQGGHGPKHFNKEVQFFFYSEKEDPFKLTLNRDIDDHYIDAVATGTALPYLKEAYNLPDKEKGSIDDLIALDSGINPYPKENVGD